MSMFTQRAATFTTATAGNARTMTAGLSGGAVAMSALLAVGLGGGVLLVTAKPLYAIGAAAAGLFIGSRLHSETETA